MGTVSVIFEQRELRRKFDLDLKDFYDENEEIMINEAIESPLLLRLNLHGKIFELKSQVCKIS